MASNVVRVQVQADSKQLQTAFDQGASAGEKFKAKMGLVGQAVVAALAFKALGAVKDFVGDSVRAFSDLNESLNAVDVSFGDAAEGIKGLGEESARNLGLSNAEFNSFAVQMSAFAHQIAGDGGDVVGVVDELSTRVADFASVMNLEVNEAARLFQSGLAGETEPLRRYGVDLSAAAVKAHAFAEGIGDGSGELSEQEKILARYSLVMEQTEKVQGDFANTADDYANAQRIANAEMENAKALAGEALVPFAQLTTQIKTLAAEAIGQFSTMLLNLTGQLSDADAHIQSFEIHMGESADTAEAALTIVKQYGGTFEELIPRLGLTHDELVRLKDADEDWLASMGFTEAQIDDLNDSVDEQVRSMDADAQATASVGDIITTNLTPAQEDLEEAVEDANVEIKTQNELLSDALSRINDLISPSFSYIENQRKLAEAQAAYNDAVEEFGENSPEAIAAAEDIAEANMGIQEAVVAIGEEGVPAAMEALKTMGVPEAVIQGFADDKKRIEELFRNMVLRIGVSAPSLFPTSPAGGGVGWVSDSKVYHAQGGVALGETHVLGEAGKEALVPLENQTGIRFMAAALVEAFSQMREIEQPQPPPPLLPLQGAVFNLNGTPESLVRDLGRTIAIETRWATG